MADRFFIREIAGGLWEIVERLPNGEIIIATLRDMARARKWAENLEREALPK